VGRDGKSDSPQWLVLRAGSSPVSDALQMVFYIEACESGSMMNHLPDDINGRYQTG
jgi:hypothetical protein